MQNRFRALNRFLGISANKTHQREKLIAGLGGFTGIALILVVTGQFLDSEDARLIVASMGASAVLLFAVPHGPLSQPWALGCGHVVSAVIGVSCYLAIPEPMLAAAAAVGLAITAMHYLHCLHPPGGATALSAVLAGSGVHALGYQYVFTPVLINVVIILSVAVAFNYLMPWRRYPAGWMPRAEENASERRASKKPRLTPARPTTPPGRVEVFPPANESRPWTQEQAQASKEAER